MDISHPKSQFSKRINARDKSCCVTGNDAEECDACHLIPDVICKELDSVYRSDPRNGILLTKSLHNLFDKFLWTFDIFDVTRDDKGNCYFKILTPNTHRKLMINAYANQRIKMPIECFPFLYVHYKMYIEHNYNHLQSSKELEMYREILSEDRVFQYLAVHDVPVQSLVESKFYEFLVQTQVITPLKAEDGSPLYEWSAIVNQRKQSEEFQVLWQFTPFSQTTWEPRKHFKRNDIETVCQKMEELHDPNY
jgi:hypothetical protein